MLRGNATLGATGASDGTGCVTGTAPSTTLQLINSSNTVVINSVQSGTGAKTYTFDTRTLPNGAYTARANERNRTGFLFCGGNNRITDRAVTIDNITALTVTAPASAPQNTTIAVSARLTDGNDSAPLSGRVVTFSLSGSAATATGTTNGSGVASANLSVNGPPRNATVSASFAQTTFYKGSTATSPFADHQERGDHHPRPAGCSGVRGGDQLHRDRRRRQRHQHPQPAPCSSR